MTRVRQQTIDIVKENGKLKAKVSINIYGAELLTMRNGYQWTGQPMSPELTRRTIDALHEQGTMKMAQTDETTQETTREATTRRVGVQRLVMPMVKNWAVHNLFSHPLSEIAYWLAWPLGKRRAKRISNWIHDVSLPDV